MVRPKKSLRKFSKKHLKTAIEKRRKLKPLKNAIRQREAAMEEKRRRVSAAEENAVSKKKKIEEMNVDDLMDGDFPDDEIDFDKDEEDQGSGSDDSLPEVDDEEDFVDITPQGQDPDSEDEDIGDDESELRTENKKYKSEISKHKMQLEKLKEKDPEFYQFLQDHDQELLEFDDEKEEEKEEKEGTEEEPETVPDQRSVLTSELVESWCKAVKEKESYAALRKLLAAFRSACHYGEGDEEDDSNDFVISSSHAFNKVMVVVLSELDDIIRSMLHAGDDKDLNIHDIRKISRWKKMLPFVKSYLSNALHVLSQMTDNRMISFTLRRLRPSIVYLGDMPSLARKYLKAVLHFWSSGEESLSFVAFTFVRDMALQLGTESLESCSKAIYKQFVANAKFINASTLPRTQFLANCVVELYGIDMIVSYQTAFSFIRQMAIILRNALTVKTKDAFKKVYCWQYVAALELWVKVVTAYSEMELKHLAYPLSQLISGVARLVPAARAFPLRMQCVILLNRLAAATKTFVPVTPLLLDMLNFKEMRKPPTGGAGSGVDFQVILKVPKPTMKTRAFQEECVMTVLEQLAEHLAQWCYSVAFPELALVPLVQLRHFIKETKVDRFRRQAKQLVEQIERNADFVTRKRDGVQFSPKDALDVAGFLEKEKEGGIAPLTQYCASLRQRAKDRKQALVKTSVEVKDQPPTQAEAEGNEKPEELFHKKWHAQKKKAGSAMQVKKKEEETKAAGSASNEDDVVEELVLSSQDEEDGEEDGFMNDADGSGDEEDEEDEEPVQQKAGKRKHKQKRTTGGRQMQARTKKNKGKSPAKKKTKMIR